MSEKTGSPLGVSDDRSMFGTRQLLIVSNRQPFVHEQTDGEGEPSVNRRVGGLTASLDPTIQETGGTWIAWGDGDADELVVDSSDRVDVPPDDPQYTLQRVWLTDEQVERYYYGFSNQVLWPLCHSALPTVHNEEAYWEAFRRTNEQFAEAVVTAVENRPVIWFQDYHFGLAPRFVRDDVGNDQLIMQFWHIPWPAVDVFRACPHGGELLDGLLGNDVLGFHVERYARNFLECVDALLDDATVDHRSGEVSYRERVTRVEAIPIGVPFETIRHTAAETSEAEFEQFRRSHGIPGDTKLAVGVDRLDYSKGIPERLRALSHFFDAYPEWQESLTYVQKETESRSEIAAYQDLQAEVDEEAERVNDRFGTDDWQPVVRVSEFLSQEELYSLYRFADVGVVSPIRDGLNLVAEEFVAAQTDEDGVLVLSTQSGVHDLLGESAVSISPFEVEPFAASIDQALTISPGERQSRMERLRRLVAVNDLESWLEKHASVVRSVERDRR